jgi:hypothetical protein
MVLTILPIRLIPRPGVKSPEIHDYAREEEMPK